MLLVAEKTDVELPAELILAGMASLGIGILIAGGKTLLRFIFSILNSAKGSMT